MGRSENEGWVGGKDGLVLSGLLGGVLIESLT